MTHESPEKSQPVDANKHSDSSSERGQERSNSKVHSETRAGMPDLVANDSKELSKLIEDRHQSLAEQIQKTGTAKIGIISKEFKCSMEITDGDNVVVKGRSRKEIVEALNQTEQIASKGMLLAPGGQFVSGEVGSPERELMPGSSTRGSSKQSQDINQDINPGINPGSGDGYSREALIAAKPAAANHGDSTPHLNADSLLNAHPELAISPSDKATMSPQLEALHKKVDDDVAKFYELRKWVSEHKSEFSEHLHNATHTKENASPTEIQDAFEKLPKPQRDALLAEQTTLQETNKRYLHLAKDTLPPEEGKLFKMSAQANFADNLAKIDHNQPPDARQKIYTSLQSILDTKKDTHPIPDERRREFAFALAEHIANPGTITQGQKNTCQVADIQKLLLQKDPGYYAEQAAALVTSGSLLFRGEPGATQSSPRKESLLSPAQVNNDDGNPQRDPLSQVMQTALADKIVKQFDPSAGYQFIDAKPGEAPEVNVGTAISPKYEKSTSGEYVIDKAGENVSFLGAQSDQEVNLLHAITGDNYKATPSEPIGNPDALAHLVQKAGSEGYPIILGITAADGPHVVAVTNFNATTGKITIMNSADFHSEEPKEQSLDQLYNWLKHQEEKYLKNHPDQDKTGHPGVGVSAIFKAK